MGVHSQGAGTFVNSIVPAKRCPKVAYPKAGQSGLGQSRVDTLLWLGAWKPPWIATGWPGTSQFRWPRPSVEQAIANGIDLVGQRHGICNIASVKLSKSAQNIPCSPLIQCPDKRFTSLHSVTSLGRLWGPRLVAHCTGLLRAADWCT
jgi:hypothetical protein